jgi:hypothetical protein
MSCLQFWILLVATARFYDSSSALQTWWWRHERPYIAIVAIVAGTFGGGGHLTATDVWFRNTCYLSQFLITL